MESYSFWENTAAVNTYLEVENLKGRDNLGEPDADGTIILKLFLYIYI
jgi:hypothetical protein